MFASTPAYSGFSVDDAEAAEHFYRDQLGLAVEHTGTGFLELVLANGARVLAYTKPDHEPAAYTMLNFEVDDIDAAVDELNARGVVTTIYNDAGFMPVDAKGIMRGAASGRGPDIAWFRDPAGNVLSVLSTSAASSGDGPGAAEA